MKRLPSSSRDAPCRKDELDGTLFVTHELHNIFKLLEISGARLKWQSAARSQWSAHRD